MATERRARKAGWVAGLRQPRHLSRVALSPRPARRACCPATPADLFCHARTNGAAKSAQANQRRKMPPSKRAHPMQVIDLLYHATQKEAAQAIRRAVSLRVFCVRMAAMSSAIGTRELEED